MYVIAAVGVLVVLLVLVAVRIRAARQGRVSGPEGGPSVVQLAPEPVERAAPASRYLRGHRGSM